MLHSIELKCFRQHTDRTFNFTKGLNTIRGENEAGKTTILLAILYCLYGARALHMPLEEFVTWGEPLKKLKATLTISKGQRLFTFTRSSKGAECNWEGGVVTGQNEVTKFAIELMGADLERARKLMFASQKGLSAALEGGAVSISAYIEELSGMGIFDTILDAVSEKLATGPTTTLDVAIAKLEEDTAVEPVMPDVTEKEAFRDLLHRNTQAMDAELVGILLRDVEEKGAKLRMIEQAARDFVQLEEDIAHAKKVVNLAQRDLEAAEIAANADVDVSRIESINRTLSSAALHAESVKAYDLYKNLQKYPDFNWTGSVEDMIKALEEKGTEVANLKEKITQLNADLRVLDNKLIVETACGLCGKDLQDVPEVQRKNEETKQVLLKVCAVLMSSEGILITAEEELKDLKLLKKIQDQYMGFYDRNHQYVNRDETVVPWKITWGSAIPQADDRDTGALRQELTELNAALKAKDIAAARLSILFENRNKAVAEVVKLEGQMLARPRPDKTIAKGLYDEAVNVRNDVYKRCMDLKQDYNNLCTELYNLEHDFKVRRRKHFDLKKELEAKQEQRKEQMRNNAFVKKIKTARPLVAAKLWQVVLASVSTMFTRMRNQKSIVTRDADSFRVNGKPAQGVSGSANDILGLAMRVALIKSFIPDCPFLILDEPLAASDANRSAAIIGFVKSCGFEQTIMITHEDISDTLSNNLIVV